jgi:hypothetical protein
VNVRFTPISDERYEKWASEQGKQRYIVTLLGRRITGNGGIKGRKIRIQVTLIGAAKKVELS